MLFAIFFYFFKSAEIVRGAVKFDKRVRGADPHSAECGRTVRGACDHYKKHASSAFNRG